MLHGNENNIPLSFVPLAPLDSIILHMSPSECGLGVGSQLSGSWAAARLGLREGPFFGPTVMLHCSTDVSLLNSFFPSTNSQAIFLGPCIQALTCTQGPIVCLETLPRISGTRHFVNLFLCRTLLIDFWLLLPGAMSYLFFA